MDSRCIGRLDFMTFRIGCRRIARVTESFVSDRDIQAIFRSLESVDNTISLEALTQFLTQNGPQSGASGRRAYVFFLFFISFRVL